MVAMFLLLVAGVLHQHGHAVLFDAVEVDLTCLLYCALFIVLYARSTEGKVDGEDGLRPVHQEEWGVPCGRTDLGPDTLDHVRELHYPPGGIGRRVIKDEVFHGLQNHLVGTFDLVVAAWMCHRRVVDVDKVVLAKVPKVCPVKAEPRSVTILWGP
jgi:hypothetical protein